MTGESMFKFVTMFSGWDSLALVLFAGVVVLYIVYNS